MGFLGTWAATVALSLLLLQLVLALFCLVDFCSFFRLPVCWRVSVSVSAVSDSMLVSDLSPSLSLSTTARFLLAVAGVAGRGSVEALLVEEGAVVVEQEVVEIGVVVEGGTAGGCCCCCCGRGETLGRDTGSSLSSRLGTRDWSKSWSTLNTICEDDIRQPQSPTWPPPASCRPRC